MISGVDWKFDNQNQKHEIEKREEGGMRPGHDNRSNQDHRPHHVAGTRMNRLPLVADAGQEGVFTKVRLEAWEHKAMVSASCAFPGAPSSLAHILREWMPRH